MNDLLQRDRPERRFAFGLHVKHETNERVRTCLMHIREAYPDDPILVIYDGGTASVGRVDILLEFQALALFGRCLKKGLSNGTAIWTRFFEHMLRFNACYLVKLDPDTIIHRRLKWLPDPIISTVCGTVMSPDSSARHIQGGFQLFTRYSAMELLDESRNEQYRNPESWNMGQANVFTKRDLVSTDYTLAAMMNNFEMQPTHLEELDCRSLPPLGNSPFREDAAVTHPHK